MSNPKDQRQAPALATAEQLAAEAILRSLLADPSVQSLLASQVERLKSTQVARRSSDAIARLDHVVQTWTGGLIMRMISGDQLKPSILLTTDNTPRTWFGYDIPATGAAGDNPDHIYRNTFLDGHGRYRIHGRIDLTRRPVQFAIEVNRGEPAKLALSAAASGTKVKNQIDIITDKDIRTDEHGRFTIDLSNTKGSKDNFLLLAEEPMNLIVRDVLSDWSQTPTWLTIERLDRPSENFSSYEMIKASLLASLPDYLTFWAEFPLRWMGGVEPNGFRPPVPRDGGWGYQAGLSYALLPGQLMLVTVKQGGAAYLGIQCADPWFIGPDARFHTGSLNTSQAYASRKGIYSYAISAEDPGIANWIDTGGLHDGLAVIRWQAVPLGEHVKDYLLEVRVMNGTELDAHYPYLLRSSEKERTKQRAEHAREYHRRFGGE
jgi:hypothetical protein